MSQVVSSMTKVIHLFMRGWFIAVNGVVTKSCSSMMNSFVKPLYFCSEEECLAAMNIFNGRWYAEKQLSCELCHVMKWKTAICGNLLCLYVLLSVVPCVVYNRCSSVVYINKV